MRCLVICASGLLAMLQTALVVVAVHSACVSARAVEPDSVDACDAACAVMAQHSCPEAQPSPGGVACALWCAEYHNAGYMRPWSVCVAAAKDVQAVRACGVGCDANR